MIQIPETVLERLDEHVAYLKGLERTIKRKFPYQTSVGISTRETEYRERMLPQARQTLQRGVTSIDGSIATICTLGLDKPAFTPVVVGYGPKANVQKLREAALRHDGGFFGITAQFNGGYACLSLGYVPLKALKKVQRSFARHKKVNKLKRSK